MSVVHVNFIESFYTRKISFQPNFCYILAGLEALGLAPAVRVFLFFDRLALTKSLPLVMPKKGRCQVTNGPLSAVAKHFGMLATNTNHRPFYKFQKYMDTVRMDIFFTPHKM